MSRVIKSSRKPQKPARTTGRYKITSDGFWADEYARTKFGAYLHYYALRMFAFGCYDVEIVDRGDDNL